MRRGPAPSFARPPRPAEPAPPALEDWAPVEGVRGSTRVQAGASRSAAALLWVLLAGALGIGVLGLLQLRVPVTAPAVTALTGGLGTAPPPGGCAELLVSAWLSGDKQVLGALIAADPPRLPAGRRAAARTYTVGVRDATTAAAGTAWSYTIGADVLAVDDTGRGAAAGTQFWAVTLVPDRTPATNTVGGPAAAGACDGWAAPVLPAQLTGIGPAAPRQLAYDRSVPVAGSPLGDTVAAFLTALLADGGPVDRYLAPGTAIAAVQPAPYATVRLERLAAGSAAVVGSGDTVPGDGTRVRVLATVTAVPAARAGEKPGQWRLAYPLSVAVRGGRWEITGIDPAPQLAAAAPSHPATVARSIPVSPAAPGR